MPSASTGGAAASARMRAELARTTIRAPVLAARHRHALGERDVAERLEGEVVGLPLDHVRRRRRAERATARCAPGARLLGEHLHGEGHQGVAGDDGRRRPERRPHRRPVAALAVVVHQVVVDQREVVHQLDRDRAGNADRLVGADGGRRQHGERRRARACRRRRRPDCRRGRVHPRWYSTGAAQAWRQAVDRGAAWPVGIEGPSASEDVGRGAVGSRHAARPLVDRGDGRAPRPRRVAAACRCAPPPPSCRASRCPSTLRRRPGPASPDAAGGAVRGAARARRGTWRAAPA